MTDESSRQQHPEADLLAGFAENSLTRNERESVLSHLAVCSRCREVVFLAHGVEPTPNIQSSELMARPFWRRSWFPVMASAAAVVMLAAVTFFWYGRFNKQTAPPGAEIAQQRTAPLPVGTATSNKTAEAAAPPPLAAPAASKQAGKYAAKHMPTDSKGEKAVVLSSPTNPVGASGDEARKMTEEAPQLALRRYQSEFSRNTGSQKSLSSGAMQGAAGAKAETQDKGGYAPRAIQAAKIGSKSKDAWDAAPSSGGAVTSAQTYRQKGAAGAAEWKKVPESKQVHGEGCVEQGVEAGCLMVRDRQSGKLYQVLIKGVRPQPGNGIEFTGVARDSATFCMQGTPLDVITWADKSSLNCAQPVAPKN